MKKLSVVLATGETVSEYHGNSDAAQTRLDWYNLNFAVSSSSIDPVIKHVEIKEETANPITKQSYAKID